MVVQSSALDANNETTNQFKSAIADFSRQTDNLLLADTISSSIKSGDTKPSDAKSVGTNPANTSNSTPHEVLPNLSIQQHPQLPAEVKPIQAPVADNKIVQNIFLSENAEGSVLTKFATAADGTKFYDQYDPTTHALTETSIIEKNGFDTSLRQENDPFSDNPVWKGQRVDSTGKAVDDVRLEYGLLFSTNIQDHTTTVQKFDNPGQSAGLPKLVPINFDADLARYSYKNPDGTETLRTIAGGHVETVFPNHAIVWKRDNGDVSTAFPDTRDAQVVHADGSSIYVFPKSALVKITQNNEPSVVESLSSTEKSFMDNHPQITDLRDFAEIHLRFRNQPEQLDSFYSALSQFDDSKQLSANQKTNMQIALMHHVAYPEEIWQGNMGSCNVTQIERELAHDQPAQLAKITYGALENASVTTYNGQTYNLDRSSLLPQDNSLRDIASRVFENASLQMEFEKFNHTFVDTPDGARVYNVPEQAFDAREQASKFNGLNLPQVNDVGYELTGETHSDIEIKSAQDLYDAFKDNGGRSMAVAVDGHRFPIVPQNVGHERGGHFVTVTDVEQVAPGKFKVAFENQWGLDFDHSTPQTMVDGDAFIQNALIPRFNKDGTAAVPNTVASIRGLEQNATYNLVNGRPNFLFTNPSAFLTKF